MNDILPLYPAPSSATVSYDEGDIRRCLGHEVDKGGTYHRRGAVRDLRADSGGRRLLANVQGTRPRPYRVVAEIEPGPPVRLSGRCTCPVAFGCKHVAAVLLAALADLRQEIVAADPLGGVLTGWLDRLRRDAGRATRSSEEIVYRLDVPPYPGRDFVLEPRIVRVLKSGGYGADRDCPSALNASTARYIQPEDRLIARLMRGFSLGLAELPNDPGTLNLVMAHVVATGRCRWRKIASPPLALGPPRAARLAWQLGEEGRQVPTISGIEGAAIALPCAAPWYVDPRSGRAGPLEFGVPAALVGAFLAAPALDAAQAAAIGGILARDFQSFALPRPRTELVEEIRDAAPVPVLRLANRQRVWGYWAASHGAADGRVAVALLGFAYDGRLIDPAPARRETRRVEGGRLVVVRRDLAAEKKAGDRLRRLGLGPAAPFNREDGDTAYLALGLPEAPAAWPGFVYEAVPQLEAEGWRVEFEDGFRHRVVDGGGEWTAAVSDGGGWWFSLDLGIDVEGERVPLLPVLTALLRQMDGPRGLDAHAHNGSVFGELADGRLVALPLERTRAILSALVELYHPETLGRDGTLDISAGEAAALAAIEGATRLRWFGGERLRLLAERLASFAGIAPVAPPAGLKTQLRPYQQAGLDWLQFLRAYDLGGILADDMGLGKTVQTLAHLLVEKREGRLDRPSIVVCPTSVVPNWCAEAARLAPELRVLSLHGSDREARFDEIAGSDLVVTTYALLPRDADRLLGVDWHVAVLDESQAIKNAATKAARLVCRLEARHRLCLTGTPVENHLGELWSQFAFLMPGLLGDSRRFARVFRNPIEKRQDGERRAVLAGRIKPFVLRRTKAVVAVDLPPKSEIPVPLDLSGPQRDLYETVRLAMHRKVRQEVAKKGFARSQIVILDALLKLRQVCCDPRLVKLAAARGVSASVKLAHLLEMLPPLIEDGRRILLFSQFTSMLDLIKPQLATAGIDFVELRGDTADRAAPVARFQSRRAPLFLISLRAGGTGLNLTAADTVIHYDPWWNPAVEDQATDRAHRIGQTKAVFVYKLMTQGTVEERMIELQQRKRAIAAGIHAARDDTAPLLDSADIDRLLAPLPG